MKKILLFTFVALASLRSVAQLESSKWYFGYNAAMDFSSGTPVAISGCAMDQFEGSASIADASGNLLFYTDGISVWDQNNNVMANGTGLMGDYSATQSALVIPYPGSDSLYYIFTVSSMGYGAYYSIVDMSLNGGLGDVTATKNVLLTSNSAEKLSAVKHANGTDYWVAIHGSMNSTLDAWQVSPTGISSSPVVSSVSISLPGDIGQLQFSPDGSKAALATYGGTYTIELFDFDNSTGIFSNAQGLTTSYYQTYGLEFSPSGKILYSGANPGTDQVYQWNLDAGSLSQIQASQTLIGSTLGDAGCLQTGPDGKIYVAQTGSNYVGVINEPDSLGSACDWNANGVNLSPGTVELGLPNFLSSFFVENVSPPVTNFAASQTSLCEKFCTNFYDSSQNNPTSWYWTFEGGSPGTSTAQNPTNICYQSPGVFDVTLVTTNSSGLSDTLTLAGYMTIFENPFAPTITQNGNLLTSSAATTYQWSLDGNTINGATDQSYTITQSGLYTVQITDENGCSSQASTQAYLVGIDEVNDDFIANLISNPNSNSFLIEVTGSAEAETDLQNVIGQKLFHQTTQLTATPSKIEFDAHELAAGIYFITIQSKGRSKTFKCVKQ